MKIKNYLFDLQEQGFQDPTREDMTMTAEIARLHELLSYDQETGVVKWAVKRRGIRIGDSAGGSINSNGYLRVCVDGRLYYLHRVSWALHFGEWPSMVIDHINCNKLDNRIENLRDVPQGVNMHNQRAPQRRDGRTSQFLGVSWAKSHNKWRAAIKVNGKSKFIGYFADETSAHNAYISAKQQFQTGVPA